MSEIAKKIKSAGYFEVSIAPATFSPQRIPMITDLAPIIEKCHVEARGWDFPHINRREPIVPDRPDSISQKSEWHDHLEVWRFFQSVGRDYDQNPACQANFPLLVTTYCNWI